RFFPRLARFRREGRLELVHADARDVVAAYDAGEPSPFDFVLLDLFTGAPEAPPLLREPGFIGGVVRCAPTVLTNAIFTLGEQGHIDWLRLFANAGAPIVAQYPTGDPDGWSTRPHNWILSSVAVEPASDFAPFADSTHYIAKALRNDFHCMVDRVVPAPAAVVSAPGCDVVPTASA
ncbi:MAG: hypothetical protein K0V04_44670, partial [Deltaproteobacteria bacterium]|nr:hypothetical protein [Deltaproteobacteria bacterium]